MGINQCQRIMSVLSAPLVIHTKSCQGEGQLNPTIAGATEVAESPDDTSTGSQPSHSSDANKLRAPAPRGCSGPGRNDQPFCGKPTETKASELCLAHNLQQKKQGALQPLRTRTSKSTCIGPGQDGGTCGRRVYSRPAGQDDGVCKTHHEQLQRNGAMRRIELRLPPLLDLCQGPGAEFNELCGRPAEARDTLLCSAHDRQQKKNGILGPIRRVNTPDVPCQGPGREGNLCGRSSQNKSLGLCGGHLAQHRKEQDLRPIKLVRKRGDVTTCLFTGCRYNDAPDGEGYCYHHWRQLQNGQTLAPLAWKSNRGRAVLDRDIAGNKLCNGCREWKPEADFSVASAARDGLNYLCRRCQASNRMKAKYGIDLDHYEDVLASQGGSCAICPRTLTAGRRLAIDHDHGCCPGEASCGNCIRGLLCPNCNRALGLFQDDSAIMMRAAQYVLRNYSAVEITPPPQALDHLHLARTQAGS